MIPTKKTTEATVDTAVGTDKKSYLQQKRNKEVEDKKKENEENISNLQNALAAVAGTSGEESLKEYLDAMVSSYLFELGKKVL